MNEAPTAQVPVRKAALAHEVDDTGEVVVFDEHGNRLLLLNQVGAAVWLMIDGVRGAHEIASLVVEALAPEAAQVPQIERDVQTFIASLLEHGVIDLR